MGPPRPVPGHLHWYNILHTMMFLINLLLPRALPEIRSQLRHSDICQVSVAAGKAHSFRK